jgi:hypothetical protein
MRIVIKALLTVAALGFGSTAAYGTAPIVVWCNNCNATQINAAVLASGAPVNVPVYVGDPLTGGYAAYDWYSDIDDSQHPPQRVKYVETIAGDATVLKGVHAYIQFYQTSPIGWHKTYSLVYNGSDPKATGWTVANFGQTQTNFNTWLNQTGTVGGNAAQFYGIGVQALGKITVLPSQAETVQFPDGSTINATQNESCGCLNAYPDSARDAEGNPIPFADSNGKIHNAGGTRNFPHTAQGDKDYTNYKNQIKNMPVVLNLNGIQIGGGGSQGGGGGGLQPTICTETDDGHGNKDIECYAG